MQRKWTLEQKAANRQRKIDKFGSYEAYTEHMRSLASFKPSEYTKQKMVKTYKKNNGDDAFKRAGSIGGKAPKRAKN